MKKISGFSFLFIFFVLLTLNVFSDEKKDKQVLDENLPLFKGASNAGKEFYLTFNPCWYDTGSAYNAIIIYISSMYNTNVTLEITGLNVSRTKNIIPYQTTPFYLLPSEAFLYSKGDGVNTVPPHPEEVGIKRAIKITSDDPIICYGMVRCSYTSDGYLAIPINNWGKNYQVASYADPTENTTQFLPSYTSIVSAYDNTEVLFKLGGNPKTGVPLETGDTLKFGQTVKRTLNKGDVWLLGGIGKNNDLTGSTITSDKNIGVISGNFCAYVPKYVGACDYIIEQEIPSEYWGKKYYVPAIYSRLKSPIVKVFAKEPNTTISLDNVPILTITDLDGKDSTGYIEMRTSSDLKPVPVLISSDKQINVVLYNTGSGDDNVPSDPFQMNIVSEAQYQTNVSFNTPGIFGGYSFEENYMNLIYKANPDGYIPDDIQFAIGENNGYINWVKLNEYSSNPGEPFKYDIPDQNGRRYYCKTIRLNANGFYCLKAKDPFAAQGYGFSKFDSYGFPLAGGMLDQTNGDTLVPSIKIVDLGNGNYTGQMTELGNPDGRVTKNPEKLQSESVSSGFSFVDIINSYSNNFKFERDDFMPGESKEINFKLTKIDRKQASKAVIYVSDRRGNDTTLILESDISNSVDDFESQHGTINIFVNKNEITINSKNEIILNSYKIYDLKGEIIQTGSPATLLNNFNIKLPNLSASVYFVELNTQYGNIVKKIIVE